MEQKQNFFIEEDFYSNNIGSGWTVVVVTTIKFYSSVL